MTTTNKSFDRDARAKVPGDQIETLRNEINELAHMAGKHGYSSIHDDYMSALKSGDSYLVTLSKLEVVHDRATRFVAAIQDIYGNAH